MLPVASLLPYLWVCRGYLSVAADGESSGRGVQMPGGGKDIFASQHPGLASLHVLLSCFPSHGQAKNLLACV